MKCNSCKEDFKTIVTCGCTHALSFSSMDRLVDFYNAIKEVYTKTTIKFEQKPEASSIAEDVNYLKKYMANNHKNAVELDRLRKNNQKQKELIDDYIKTAVGLEKKVFDAENKLAEQKAHYTTNIKSIKSILTGE